MGNPHGSSNPIIYEGATMTDLRYMFGLKHGEVRIKLASLKPCGERSGFPIYKIRDAARLLVPPADDAEQVARILRMAHTELPNTLRKEFWQAETSRQKFQREAGDLWATSEIVEFVGGAFKTLRLSLQLLADAVEREGTLTDTQRLTIQRLVDATLDDMRERMIHGFENRREPAVGGSDAPEENDEGPGLP